MENQNAPYGRLDSLETTPMSSSTKKEILLVSGILGVCIVVFHYLGEWMGKLLLSQVNAGNVPYTFTMAQVYQILFTILTILVPFAIGAVVIKRVQKRDELLPLGKPKSGMLFLEALGIGCIAIVAANMATALFIAILNGVGVEFDNYKPEGAKSTYELLWMLLSNAIVPALVEEFALRGVILQSLRKYGDAFAVFASALIFAMMHGNMTQAPFAFILGAVLAMLVIMTGSLWTSMAVHLLNNTYSVIANSIFDKGDDLMTSMVVVSVYTLAAIYGVIALVYFFGMHHGMEGVRSRYMPGGPSKTGITLYRRQAWLYTIVSPTMVIALVLMLIDLVKTVHMTG